MYGKTDIKIKEITYGISFDTLALGEMITRFELDPINKPDTLKSIFSMLKLVYCGMISYYENDRNPNKNKIIDYYDFLDCNKNGDIGNNELIKVFNAFRESMEVSKAIQLPNEHKDADKKKVNKSPLVKPVS